MNIASKIRKIRELKGFSQEYVAPHWASRKRLTANSKKTIKM
jgi:hypothetical protein